MIHLLGDTHIRKEEPFFSTVEHIFNDVYDACDYNDSVIQLGDFFHTYKPFPKEYKLALACLDRFKHKHVMWYILAGNNAHEYHYQQKTFAIDPLNDDNVDLITSISIRTIDGVVFLMLPWQPHDKLKENGFDSLEHCIRNFVEEYEGEDPDYVLYHFEDETVFMGGMNTGINLSFLEERWPNIKRVGGHIHLQSKNYIGTPYQTRADELGQSGHMITIKDKDESSEIPFRQYIKYVDLDYSDEIPELEFKGQNFILNISNAPSISSAYERFKGNNIYINNVKVMFKSGERGESGEELDSTKPIGELLNEYLNINKVDTDVSSYLRKLF